jgi:hypothetical protein
VQQGGNDLVRRPLMGRNGVQSSDNGFLRRFLHASLDRLHTECLPQDVVQQCLRGAVGDLGETSVAAEVNHSYSRSE